METQTVRKTLHQLIDQTKDAELLTFCVQLLERDIRKTSSGEQGFFNTSVADLTSRAEASMEAISAGRTRKVKEFKKEVDQWKQNKPIQ